MMLVSDGGASMKFPLFLNDKTKEKVLAAFRHWVTAAELQTGKRLKCVRVDLGREFDVMREASDGQRNASRCLL